MMDDELRKFEFEIHIHNKKNQILALEAEIYDLQLGLDSEALPTDFSAWLDDAEQTVKAFTPRPEDENEKVCLINLIESARGWYKQGKIKQVKIEWHMIRTNWDALKFNTWLEGLLVANEKRLKGFNVKNNEFRDAKKSAQDRAVQLWREDVDKKIRLKDMCHKVWGHFVDNGISLPYDAAEGLKPLLREVAPDYAKLAGAPKK